MSEMKIEDDNVKCPVCGSIMLAIYGFGWYKLVMLQQEIVSLKKYIAILEKQISQQDKTIERKDMQFQGLKACYKDDLINNLV